MEVAHPSAFHYHMFGATTAYWFARELPSTLDAARLLLFPDSKAARLAARLEGVRSSLPPWLCNFKEMGHKLAMSILLAGTVWNLHYKELNSYTYFLARDLAHLANFPVALAGLLLPEGLRGLQVWFFDASRYKTEMSLLNLGIHLLLGTLVYYLIFSCYFWLKRRQSRLQTGNELDCKD